MGDHESQGEISIIDGLGIEVVAHLDFEAIDELPFVLTPANARAIEDHFIPDDPTAASPRRAGELAGSGSVPSVAANAFSTLVGVMTKAMLARGAGPEAVHVLRALVGFERMGGQSPGEAACSALVAAKLATTSGRGLARTAQFEREVLAWQRILSGESDDLAACGPAALDEWAAAIVASTLGDATQAGIIRRELRGHGVAAFGLVSDAAA